MKIIKLKNKDFKDITKTYKRNGAIKGRVVYPYHAYVSPKTYEKLRKATYSEYKKAYPYLSKNQLAYNSELDLLNFGPCTLKGLQDGVMLIDTKAIESSKGGE